LTYSSVQIADAAFSLRCNETARRPTGGSNLNRRKAVGRARDARRLPADAGYRDHNAPPDYTSMQKRRLTAQVEREMRRGSTIEPSCPNAQWELD
jgi:hypothetical protein